MAVFRIESLEGSVPQITIEGAATKSDHDLFRALSNLSKAHHIALVNLNALSTGDQDFFTHLQEISARTKLKVISANKAVIDGCAEVGLQVFPSVKSAQLALVGEETISMMMAKLRDVPIINTDAYQLVSYTAGINANYEEIERMIRDKPSIVGQIMRLANSSFFYRKQRVDTLQAALVTIGLAYLRRLFLFNFYSSVTNIFTVQKPVIEHGKLTAMLAEYICKAANAPREDHSKVWLGGLLHDIGSQALAFFFPEKYERARKLMKEENKPSYLAELVTFGTEHQTVGRMLATKWNFPDYLVNIVGDHHYLAAVGWNKLTLPVFCANNFLNERDRIPFNSYYSKLVGYFMLYKMDVPWKDPVAEFAKVITSGEFGPY